MRINPFLDIYKKCNSASNAERYAMFSEEKITVPLYLDIELTNSCNMQCNMCPVGTGSMKRKSGYMTEEVFLRLLDDIKRYHIQGVRFIRWGEPTLHPRFLEWAKELKGLDILVHFNTNGLLIDENMIAGVIDSGVDSVKFSFQGIDELTYSEMRRGGGYTRLLTSIRKIHEMRGKRRKPYISVSTSTTYESEEEIEKFWTQVAPYCDEVNIGRTKMQHVDISCMGINDERRSVYERFIKEDKGSMQHMVVCPEIWDKLSINFDGSVSACCQDYDNMMIVGHILENNLQEIFLGVREKYYREILKNDEYDKLPLCRNCCEYIPLKRN